MAKTVDVALLIDEKVPGAWPNGTRVRKTLVEEGDRHEAGALATVVGSVQSGGVLAYFVVWDDLPGLPVLVKAMKVGLLD